MIDSLALKFLIIAGLPVALFLFIRWKPKAHRDGAGFAGDSGSEAGSGCGGGGD